MYVCVLIEHGAAPLSTSDESPRVSAAVSRENAVRCHLASPRYSRNPCWSSLNCGVSHVTFHITSCVVALSPARGVWGARAWRDGVDEPTRPCCFSRFVRIVARTVFAVVNNIYCIPAYMVWMMALRLVRPLYAPIYWKTEGLMYHWLLAMVSMWSSTAGYKIVETGDEPATCSGRRTLVLANHQSTGDVPMLMAAWNPRPGVLSNLMWIMDRIFKFTNFGIVSVLHEDFFIQAGKSKREQSLEDLKIHIHKSYIPLGRQLMVLFPEGGFLHKRREISHRFAEKNNLPKLEYVSLPRAGAMKIIMEEIGPFRNSGASSSRQARRDNDFNQNNEKMILDTNSGDHIEWILDVTIAYPERVPLHLYDIVCGIRPPCTTHLHYRLYPADEVPSDTEGMTQWLYDRFIEKDKMLEEFYRTGQFPCKEGICQHERIVRQDNLRYLILHLFFILSTVIQFKLFYYLIRTFIW